MTAKCLVFAYGLLKPGHTPPRSVSQHWPDRIPGLLYDLGNYPAGIQLGHAASWIEGITMELDQDELDLLDEFEDVESGEYRRIVVTSEQGFDVWAYEYMRAIPADLPPVPRWK